MPFNRTGQGRARFIAAQVRLMSSLERSMRSKVKPIIDLTVKNASEAYKDSGRSSLEMVMTGEAARLMPVFKAHYTVTAHAFGKKIFDAVGKSRREFERKDTQGAFDQSLNTWIAKYATSRVTSIASTTRKQIIDAISDGEAGGIGVDAIARYIVNRAGGEISSARAAIIARTETHAAAMFGSDAAADATGVQNIKREWMAVEDNRTRPSHSDADGELVGMDEPFQVGGSALERPGDPSGPPEETINCRCVIGYNVPGF